MKNTFAHLGYWSIDPSHLTISTSEGDKKAEECFHKYMEANSLNSESNEADPHLIDGILHLSISGTMTKFRSWWSSYFGGGGLSTSELAGKLSTATNDPDVKGVFLKIYSPGGQVDGISDLAESIKMFGAEKPIYGHICDTGLSASYWVASQCSYLTANKSSLVGNIGTYLRLLDSSGLYEQNGLKVHVIKAGSVKGAGVEGAPITDEHLEEFQRIVNSINALFVESVQSGRNLTDEQIESVANGRVFIGSEALENRLIDEICSEAYCLDLLKQKIESMTPKADTLWW